MLREWISSTFSNDKLERALDQLSEKVPDHDAWGYSPKDSQALAKIASGVYKYFRPEISGIENLPSGRVLIVPNHSGQLPFDAMVVSTACLVDAEPARMCRAMVERWVPTLPFVNVMMSRAGAVVGDPINCRNLLEEDNAILVFPEGAKGSGKTWWKRYQLERFGRGFMRLALQTNSPIVPVSVVGAEESIISLHDARTLADLFGMPYVPVPLLLPLLGPLAMFPLPTKFYVDFGEPMLFEGPFDDEDEAIDIKVEQVRARVQSMINDRLAKRDSIF